MLKAGYEPQKNGVVEQRCQTLLKMTQCLMKKKDTPNHI